MLKRFSTLFLFVSIPCFAQKETNLGIANRLLAGEVSCTGAILEAQPLEAIKEKYLTFRFECSTEANFSKNEIRTPLGRISVDQDFVFRQKADHLRPATRYFYRFLAQSKSNTKDYIKSAVGSFRTLSCVTPTNVNLVLSSCMHYDKFMFGPKLDGKGAKGTGLEKAGFAALPHILNLKPDFWILNGDNVYYDHNYPVDSAWNNRAKTRAEMRVKWKLLFEMPSLSAALSTTGTYWLKDDHDFRYDDADLSDTNRYPDKAIYMAQPSVKDGIEVFREQVPVAMSAVEKTYRTHLISPDMQIWFLEGRDYRSPKFQKPGPEKTIWGKEQKEWLCNTLKESKAKYKLIVSPSPMVGPDENRKTDNHANSDGYKAEADAFFNFLSSNNFNPNETLILCGDRHWQYHSIHPSGYQEFCSGALNDENARKGVPPGGPKSSDPDSKIKQPFLATDASGGFIQVTLNSGVLNIIYFNDEGKEVYRYSK